MKLSLCFCPGLNLLDIITSLREQNDEQLDIQCDVFYEELDEDDEANAEVRAVQGSRGSDICCGKSERRKADIIIYTKSSY